MNNLIVICKNGGLKALKNSIIGKKGVVLLCGQNLLEYSDKFDKFLNDPNIITLAYKNSSNILNKDPDILFLDTRIKNTRVPNDNTLIVYNNDGTTTEYETIYRSDEFSPHIFIKSHNSNGIQYVGYKELSNYKFDEIIEGNTINNQSTTDNYSQCLLFLNYLGIKEIYILGAFNIKNPDIRKFNRSYHYYNIDKVGGYVIETGHMMHAMASHFWYKYLKEKGCSIYNVSQSGSLCEYIPRIDFNDIFTDDKTITNKPIDDCCLFSFISNRLDPDFYIENYIKDRNPTADKEQICIKHYIWNGYFCGCKLNENDDHNMWDICEPLRRVIFDKKYDMKLLYLYNLFKYPKLAIRQGLKNSEFLFQNHILSPSILGDKNYKDLPLTWEECDLIIDKLQFNYEEIMQQNGDDKNFGGGAFQMSMKEIKQHLPQGVHSKYIALVIYLITSSANVR